MKSYLVFVSIIIFSCSSGPEKTNTDVAKEADTAAGINSIPKTEADTLKNAGSFGSVDTLKSLIGKIFTNSRSIPELQGWEYREGNVVTPLKNPEMITSEVFQKGNNWIVFYSVRENDTSPGFTILDLLEVNDVPDGWIIRTAFCRKDGKDNIELLAMVRWSPSEEYLKPAKKAWRFNRDKRRFESISVNGIDCLNEGVD